jgi:hypothetical protein
MSKSRTRTKSQYGKSKEDNPSEMFKSKSRTRSRTISRKSPGISRVLRKRNAKYTSSPQINKLMDRLSFEESQSLNSSLMNAVFSNQNICIYPKEIPILVQVYNSYTNYIPLNQAFSIEEYKDFERYLKGDNLELYQNIFLKSYEKVWYEDTSKFENECSKDVVIFPIDLILYGLESGFTPFFNGRHACFLLVDKKNKKAYYIDSQDNKKEEKDKKISQAVYTEKKMEQYICLKAEAWIYHLLGLRIKVNVLDVEAPQTVTNDYYCLFWSIMLADTIIRHYDTSGKVEPKKVIQLIRKKYDTKEKLNTLIRRYISYIKSIEEEYFPEPEPIPEPPKKKSFWQKVKDYIENF